MKNGVILKTNAKDELELGEILNDKGFFITIGGVGNINKLEIRNTFKMGNNPVLEGIAKHSYAEQLALVSIMKARAKDGKSVKTYEQLMEIFNDMKKRGEIATLDLPFYATLDENVYLVGK